MCVIAVLLVAPFWRNLLQAKQARTFVYLIPQALPLAIPIGLTIGILYGFRGRVLSRKLSMTLRHHGLVF
jgi:lipopolysaccharide export LptBFGC system permease protein LptF